MTGSEFRESRRKLGLSQTKMAAAMGYERKATISDMENGRQAITPQAALLVQALLREKKAKDGTAE